MNVQELKKQLDEYPDNWTVILGWYGGEVELIGTETDFSGTPTEKVHLVGDR